MPLKLTRMVGGAVLVAIGMIGGAALQAPDAAFAEVRGNQPPTPFLSGGQLSVPLLKEIAATLKSIDGRVARLEAAAQKLQKPDRAQNR